MRTRRTGLPWIFCSLLAVFIVLSFCLGEAHGQSPANELLALINNARRAQGLHPYVFSARLTAAAQRHSNDMAATGQIDHIGSDGTSDIQRMLEAGFGVYEFGPVVGENVYGGMGSAQATFDEWMDQSGARSNVLHDKYREAGIGVARDDQGRVFWTLTVGAQPNVLPVLINEGVLTVQTITVTLRLVSENVVPEGRGTAMGQPVAYRASTNPQFVGSEWQPWAEQATFVLEESLDRQTVYVQLRDAAERTAVSQAGVTVVAQAGTVTATATAQPGTPITSTATLTATTAPTSTPETSPEPTVTPTSTAMPTATPTPTPSPSATALPTGTATPMLSATSLPTSTSTNTPAPTASVEIPAPTDTRAILQTSAQTPATLAALPTPTPRQSIVSEELFENETQPPSLAARVAPWVLGLQLFALILGVYVTLRRPNSLLGGDGELPSDRDGNA